MLVARLPHAWRGVMVLSGSDGADGQLSGDVVGRCLASVGHWTEFPTEQLFLDGHAGCCGEADDERTESTEVDDRAGISAAFVGARRFGGGEAVADVDDDKCRVSEVDLDRNASGRHGYSLR